MKYTSVYCMLHLYICIDLNIWKTFPGYGMVNKPH